MLRGYSLHNIDFARRRALSAAPRAGGVRRKLLVFLVLVVGIVALLPMIIAKTPLLGMIVNAATPSDASETMYMRLPPATQNMAPIMGMKTIEVPKSGCIMIGMK